MKIEVAELYCDSFFHSINSFTLKHPELILEMALIIVVHWTQRLKKKKKGHQKLLLKNTVSKWSLSHCSTFKNLSSCLFPNLADFAHSFGAAAAITVKLSNTFFLNV